MLSFPLRTASELSPFVRTMLIPHGIASRQPSNSATLRVDKIHPYVDFATIHRETARLLKFELPLGDDQRFFQVVMDGKNLSAAVVFGRVGLGNHGYAEIQMGNTKVFCGETAFVLRRLCFMYEKAPKDTDAHICDVWDSIVKADTPHGSQGASRGLRSDLFKGPEWDADSKDQMFSVLLSKYTNDEAAYNHLKALDDILIEHRIADVCFVEVGDNKIWASGASGDKTVEAILALEHINPASVAGAVAKLGGQNKLGQAYDLLHEAFVDSEIHCFESFKTLVEVSIVNLNTPNTSTHILGTPFITYVYIPKANFLYGMYGSVGTCMLPHIPTRFIRVQSLKESRGLCCPPRMSATQHGCV